MELLPEDEMPANDGNNPRSAGQWTPTAPTAPSGHPYAAPYAAMPVAGPQRAAHYREASIIAPTVVVSPANVCN